MNQGKELQLKASEFFDKTASETSGMQCRKGCSQCCHVQLSIFTWEAKIIHDWFAQLDPSERDLLMTLWQIPQEKAIDLHQNLTPPCPFLYEQKCSIYPARPIICRTQGLPLLIDQELSVCPLNYTDELPEKKYWLDLGRLNLLSSLIEKNQSPNTTHNNSRQSLVDVKNQLIKLYKKN